MGDAARVLTVSDSVVEGTRADTTGPAIVSLLEAAGFEIDAVEVVSDGIASVSDALRRLSAGFSGLLLTAGGTGFSLRDVTPEATRGVLEREAPGIPEVMRASSPLGALSRSVAGTIGTCLVVNLPGSPKGATESLGAILEILPHALSLLRGDTAHH